MTAGISARGGWPSERYIGGGVASERYVGRGGAMSDKYRARAGRRTRPAPPPALAIVADPIRAKSVSLERPDRIVIAFGSRMVFRDGEGVYLPQQAFVIVAALLVAHGGAISRWDLVEALYADDPDGGPEDAPSCFQTRLCTDVRPQLRKLGLTVEWPMTGHLWVRDLRGN